MPVVFHDNVPFDPFRTGATYQTLVGDERGSTPFRIGIQTSSPGYRTQLHSHPYMEALTILEGEGEAGWRAARAGSAQPRASSARGRSRPAACMHRHTGSSSFMRMTRKADPA